MKKEINFLLSDEAYRTYINYIHNKFFRNKSVCPSCYKNLLSGKLEYDSYIKELENKSFAEVLEDYYKEHEKVIIAASFREPDEKQKTMKEDFIMLGFSGDYIGEVCEEMKDKSTKWLMQEEMRLKRKFDVFKFAKNFLKQLNPNLKILKPEELSTGNYHK